MTYRAALPLVLVVAWGVETLRAGDEPAASSELERAVAAFGHDAAPARFAASDLALHESRRLLQPLLDALQDDDPEVRRRALVVLNALVPQELLPEPEPQPAAGPNMRQLVVLRNVKGQVQVQWKGAQVQLRGAAFQFVPQPAVNKDLVKRLNGWAIVKNEAQRMGKLGITGRATKDGYVLTRVLPRSRAAKLGLRKGDRIAAVGRHRGSALTILRLLEKAEDPAKDVIVERDGAVVRLRQRG